MWFALVFVIKATWQLDSIVTAYLNVLIGSQVAYVRDVLIYFCSQIQNSVCAFIIVFWCTQFGESQWDLLSSVDSMCRTRLPIPKRNPEQRQCYVMVTWRCMLRLNSSCLVSRQTSWISLYRSWRPSRFVRIICPVRCCSWWCPKPPGAKALIGTLLSPWPHNDGCLSAIVSQKEIMVSEMAK